MSSLSRGTEDLLLSAGAFQVSRSALANEIHDVIWTLKDDSGFLGVSFGEHLDTEEKDWGDLEPLPENSLELLRFLHRLRVHARKVGIKGSFDRGEFGWSRESAIEFLEKIASKIADGNELFSSDERAYISRHSVDLAPLWHSLGEICWQLERLARKQLDEQQFTEEGDLFVRNYGIRISEVMLYLSNSYLRPGDDAPRIVDVAFDSRQNKYLHVGISRPRALYVLYPHQGREILCRGAVLPYYEFAYGDRLTNDRWKEMLDSPGLPASPEWALRRLHQAP